MVFSTSPCLSTQNELAPLASANLSNANHFAAVDAFYTQIIRHNLSQGDIFFFESLEKVLFSAESCSVLQ